MYYSLCTQISICFSFLHRANLCLVKELGDWAAQGRTYGNLGNAYYLLGEFETAVAAHEKVWGMLHLHQNIFHTLLFTSMEGQGTRNIEFLFT